MRALLATALVCAALVPGLAGASYTVDLIWSVTGLPYLNISPGDPTAANSGPCAAGALSTITTGRCLEVRLTAAAPFKAAVMSIGWHSGSSGLLLGGTGARSFGLFGSGPPGLAPVSPNVAGTSSCAGIVGPYTGSGCDSAHGSFGGTTAALAPAGTYLIGSINFDTSGVLVGVHDVLAFIRAGVGGVTDKQGNPAPVQLNGAVIDIGHGPPIPEPGTAALLGAGLLALASLGRSRTP